MEKKLREDLDCEKQHRAEQLTGTSANNEVRKSERKTALRNFKGPKRKNVATAN